MAEPKLEPKTLAAMPRGLLKPSASQGQGRLVQLSACLSPGAEVLRPQAGKVLGLSQGWGLGSSLESEGEGRRRCTSTARQPPSAEENSGASMEDRLSPALPSPHPSLPQVPSWGVAGSRTAFQKS